MYVPTKDNPEDHLSRGCTSKQLKSSNWLHGPAWLLTHEFPEQSNINIVVNELTVEINPVHPIPPLIDLIKFSSFLRVLRIMTRVLEFFQSPSNPFEKLVRQEQLLHCTSIHAHLTNSRVNVNVNGALLLTTGVTTLFRDERKTTPLITLALFVRVVILIAGVRKTRETFHRHFINSFQNKYVKDAK